MPRVEPVSAVQPLIAALRFLTILPFPARWEGENGALARSLAWFPLVGLLLGLSVAGLDRLFLGVFPSLLLPSVLSVLLLSGLSGFLHLDGLADTADAFGSCRNRERMLEIMKDSRTGPMGVTAICGLLLLKVAALTSLTGEMRMPVLVLAPLAGRCALVVQTLLLPYAKPEGGLASIFQQGAQKHLALFSSAGFVLVSLLLVSWNGFWLSLACGLLLFGYSRYCLDKLAGLTGDTLGAGCELLEAGLLLSAAAVLGGP